jgi:hypothetical protein
MALDNAHAGNPVKQWFPNFREYYYHPENLQNPMLVPNPRYLIQYVWIMNVYIYQDPRSHTLGDNVLGSTSVN